MIKKAAATVSKKAKKAEPRERWLVLAHTATGLNSALSEVRASGVTADLVAALPKSEVTGVFDVVYDPDGVIQRTTTENRRRFLELVNPKSGEIRNALG